MNPTLLGVLLAAAPIAYDLLKSKPRGKRKSAHRRKHKHARRRNRR